MDDPCARMTQSHRGPEAKQLRCALSAAGAGAYFQRSPDDNLTDRGNEDGGATSVYFVGNLQGKVFIRDTGQNQVKETANCRSSGFGVGSLGFL